eukprot:UN01322
MEKCKQYMIFIAPLLSCSFQETFAVINEYAKLQNSQCIFTDNSTEETLDLSYFVDNKKVLVFSAMWDDTNYTYLYSPCSNGVSNIEKDGCRNIATMAVEYNHFYGWCNDLARWDNGFTEPTYSKDSDESTWTWKFYYFNAGICHDEELPSHLEIQWVCDNTTDYTWEKAYDEGIYGECLHLYYFKSRWACSGYIPPINSTGCKWTAENGKNVLDLTSLNETILINDDSSNISLYFVYTPCKNGIGCGGVKVMASLENFEENTCDN